LGTCHLEALLLWKQLWNTVLRQLVLIIGETSLIKHSNILWQRWWKISRHFKCIQQKIFRFVIDDLLSFVQWVCSSPQKQRYIKCVVEPLTHCWSWCFVLLWMHEIFIILIFQITIVIIMHWLSSYHFYLLVFFYTFLKHYYLMGVSLFDWS
jgi:hypothetical protein